MIPNSTYIDELSGGDPVFRQRLIDVIHKEFPEEKEAYYQSYTEKKYKIAAENVHKLKHKISILGLERSYAIAQDYEKNLLEGTTLLEADFSDIIRLIASFLETQ